MTTQLDGSVGIKVESVYGTAVTVDQFFEYTDETFDRNPEFVQGQGLRVGSRVDRSARRLLGAEGVEGSLTVEACLKGLGVLLNAAFGAVVNTAVTGATGAYQQNHTPATTDPISSYTIQKGVPPVGGGTTTQMTFLGMVCTGIEFSAKAGEIVEVSTDWAGREVETTTAYAAPSYPASNELFTFVHGGIYLGGTYTKPTTTALASTTASAAGNVLDFSLKYANGLDDGARAFGGAGKITRKPVLGRATIEGSLEVEYDATTLRDAYLNQTDLALVLNFTHTTTIGTGTPVPAALQISVPLIRLEGELPKTSSKGEAITQSIDFTGLDSLAASTSPIYVCYRTTDTAP